MAIGLFLIFFNLIRGTIEMINLTEKNKTLAQFLKFTIQDAKKLTKTMILERLKDVVKALEE